MSNAPSFGKSITILLIGAAVGFAGCTTALPDVAGPPPVACAEPTVDEVVTISLKGGQLEIDHDYVFLQVLDCEQVVWTSAAITDFTVSIEHKREFRPGSAVPPPNPFPGVFTGAGDAVVFSADSSNGTLASHLPVPATAGHLYKFKIEADGYEPIDPHVVFD